MNLKVGFGAAVRRRTASARVRLGVAIAMLDRSVVRLRLETP